jgi:flavin-dependent dehydrogenase
VSAISQRLCRSERRQPWLAVGDAALAVDPVTGSGVVRALRSAKAASRTALALLEGCTETIEQYETEWDGECTNYLHERALYYGAEQRWPKSAFWQRRVAAAAQFIPSKV